jgi:hypothetical protein
LRRDPAGGAEPERRVVPDDSEEAAREGLPEWFKDRLSRGAAEPSAAWRDRATGDPRDLEPGSNELGPFAARRTRFDAAAPHGQFRLREVDHADAEALCFLTGDERLVELDPRTAVYLDIETTGLSGGAGTVPFMV